MISDGRPFDTNVFFSGGAGMFIQYHDVIKPVYLYAILKMIWTQNTFGLPFSIISKMSLLSIIEWYIHRRYKNPLQSIDFRHILNVDDLDEILHSVLLNDPSIYKLSPTLNAVQLFNAYQMAHMSFPVYVYSEQEEPPIRDDIKTLLSGVNAKYIYGDLKECIRKCDENFTYIFSDIELVKKAADILYGTCSHILITSDYRYNYRDIGRVFKYDLNQLASSHPYIRISVTNAIRIDDLVQQVNTMLSSQEG